jgi:hypothetical protein
MRPRTLLTALLVAAALVVAAAAIGRFARSRHGAERASGEVRGAPVLVLDPRRAVALRVTSPGEELRAVREGGRWALAPQAAGDPRAAQVIVERLAELRRRTTSAPAGLSRERLVPYGLDAPRRRFEVTLAGGRVETLAVGGTTEFEGTTFVMPTSGDVVIVSAAAREELDRAVDALRGGPAPKAGGPAPAGGPTPAPAAVRGG